MGQGNREQAGLSRDTVHGVHGLGCEYRCIDAFFIDTANAMVIKTFLALLFMQMSVP